MNLFSEIRIKKAAERAVERKAASSADPAVGQDAPGALVDLASESWRFSRTVERAAPGMDPMDAERFLNQYGWYSRKVEEVLREAGLRVVDLTGEIYHVGMAVTPLNLEDFPQREGAKYRIAQMVDPIVMEGSRVRKPGSVMLSEVLEEDE